MSAHLLCRQITPDARIEDATSHIETEELTGVILVSATNAMPYVHHPSQVRAALGPGYTARSPEASHPERTVKKSGQRGGDSN